MKWKREQINGIHTKQFIKFACYRLKGWNTSKSKAGDFNWQNHRSLYWLTDAFKEAFQAAKATHDLEEHLQLYTRSSYLSLWKNMKTCANLIFQLIGQERSRCGTGSILCKAQRLSNLWAGCVIILLGGHFYRWRTQSSSHNCSTLKGQSLQDCYDCLLKWTCDLDNSGKQSLQRMAKKVREIRTQDEKALRGWLCCEHLHASSNTNCSN